MRRLTLLIAIAGLFAVGAAPAFGQSVQLVPFGGQTFNQPFYVASPPGDTTRVFVVEGPGTIRLVKNGATQATPFLNISADVFDQNEGGCECGLFSIAFAPDYATSGLFYAFYTRDTSPGNHFLRIEEFRRSTGNPDLADLSSRRIVLEIPHLTASNHNGGQLQFGPDGYLYIATGDGGNTPENGQAIGTLLGKVLRIDPEGTDPFDYTIPADNPFFGATAGADEIYAYGLRNPYRFSFDRLTGDLALGDVGGGSREEIDFRPLGSGRGANFGWTCYEGTQVHSTSGLCNPLPANHTPPVLEYLHGPGSAAVNGGYVIRDGTLPSLLGRYVYADTFDALGGQLHTAVLSTGGATGTPLGVFATTVVSFGEDACGHVYVAEMGGEVSRIQASSSPPVCQPQTALPPTPPSPSQDTTPPGLTLDLSKAKRAGARGEVRLIVGCDETCFLQARGEITVPGKDIGLSPGSGSAPAGGRAALSLDLSAKEARRLRAELRRGGKAKAGVHVTATDLAGNVGAADRRVRQKR
jgi:glucose/arabinose dehydrogenase